MLATVVLVTAAVAPNELRRLRGDVAAALTYSTNWTQIVWHRSYFEQLGRPSLLQHLWSLAVEEQFYLLWPLVLVLCLRTGGRRRALRVTLIGIVISAVVMAWLFQSYPDPDRAYYGSDTHASALLVGAALALATALRRPVRGDRPPAPLRMTVNSPTWPLDVAALLGSVVVGYFLTHANYFSDGLYRGGFLLVAIGSAAIVLAAGRRGTVTARLLGTPLLCWIGVRSYAIYLWHWPVFMLSRPRLDYPSDGLPAHGAARRVDGCARRPVVPVHRAADPNSGFRGLRPVGAGSFSPAPLRSDSSPDRLRGRARPGCRSVCGVASPGGRFRVRHPHERSASVASRYAKSVGISDTGAPAGLRLALRPSGARHGVRRLRKG